LEDEGFYGAATDPDPDADTGPVHVVTPTDEDVAHVEDVAVEQSYYPPPVEDTDFEETRPVQWPQAYRPPEQDTFAGRFTAPLTVDPRTTPVKSDGVTRGTAVVNCPGNIQSPGPWRRNATPRQVSGTLVCGLQQSRPTVAWTDDIVLLLGVVRADDKGPTLDQLYAWWSSHS
jgi:hypothetical protein